MATISSKAAENILAVWEKFKASFHKKDPHLRLIRKHLTDEKIRRLHEETLQAQRYKKLFVNI